MKVLIVGGAGFVGAQLSFYLKEHGYQVVVIDNLVRRGSELNLSRFQRHGIPFFHGDVRNPEDLMGLPKDIEVICQAAAQPSVVSGYSNPIFDINNNLLGLMNTLEFARHRGCGLIFWSTNKVYSADRINQFPRIEGDTRWTWDKDRISIEYANLPPGFDPDHGFSENFTIDGGQHSIYGLSKVMADLACQEYYHAFGVPTVINRFSCLAGPGQFGRTEQGWVTWFAIAFHFGLPLQFIGWGGKQVRDVLFIEDMCRLIELQIENLHHIRGQVFNIGGGKGNTMSLIEAVRLLEQIYGRCPDIMLKQSPRKADQCIYISDIRKAQKLLGWRPTVGIETGYRRIIDWIERNENALRRLYCK